MVQIDIATTQYTADLFWVAETAKFFLFLAESIHRTPAVLRRRDGARCALRALRRRSTSHCTGPVAASRASPVSSNVERQVRKEATASGQSLADPLRLTNPPPHGET